MKALVTGGGGFIGSRVVRELLREGIEPRVLLREGEDTRNLAGLDLETMHGDVRDPEAMHRAVAGCAWVFHLAAIYALWLPHPETMREVNVGGTRNVLQAARDRGVERVVCTSSIAVFGGQGLDRDARESSPYVLGPTGNLYAQTKYEAHRLALSFVERGLDVVLAAPCGPIGPGDLGPTPTGRFLLAVVNAPLCPVVETISNFGDVRDIGRGHVLAARKGRTGESYLLGTENLRYADLASMVERVTGVCKPRLRVPDPILKAASRAMEWMADRGVHRPPLLTPSSVEIGRLGLRADCSKARDELGLPQGSLERAVEDALHWFAENGHIRSRRIRRALASRREKGESP